MGKRTNMLVVAEALHDGNFRKDGRQNAALQDTLRNVEHFDGHGVAGLCAAEVTPPPAVTTRELRDD